MFVERAKRRDDPFSIWGSAEQVRDWVHIDDIVAAAMAIVTSDTEEPVNICTGLGISMLRLQRLVCDAAGYDPEVEVITTAPLGVLRRVGDPTLLNTFYTPRITLEEGVRRAFEEK
jgi:nucleoside-diphosphate-sugar epimerase